MPIRRVKQNSDRGSIKELAANLAAGNIPDTNEPLSSIESRMQKLFNYSVNNDDKTLQSSLGIISANNVSIKSSMPLAVYHIRQIVADIKSKSGEAIANLEKQFSEYIAYDLSPGQKQILNKRAMVKTASERKPPIFRRVSKI